VRLPVASPTARRTASPRHTNPPAAGSISVTTCLPAHPKMLRELEDEPLHFKLSRHFHQVNAALLTLVATSMPALRCRRQHRSQMYDPSIRSPKQSLQRREIRTSHTISLDPRFGGPRPAKSPDIHDAKSFPTDFPIKPRPPVTSTQLCLSVSMTSITGESPASLCSHLSYYRIKLTNIHALALTNRRMLPSVCSAIWLPLRRWRFRLII
jgi:hypothetical protein